MKSTRDILFSDMVDPKTASDGISIGQCVLEWDNQNLLDMELVTEFHFYDTIIKIVFYPKNAPYKKQTKYITNATTIY